MIACRKLFTVLGASLGMLLVFLAASGVYIRAESHRVASEDPLIWERDIRGFEVDAQSNHLPEHAVLFLGSSSIRLWSSLAQDMYPIPVIQRGFGGAKLNDVLYYAIDW